MRILVATRDALLLADPGDALLRAARGVDRRPTCLAAGPEAGRAWAGTEDGVLRSDDGGESWAFAGVDGEEVTAVATGPGTVWAGTEPSALFRTADGGATWSRAEGLTDLPSSSEWSFPPKPETHHVRWIAPRPDDAGRLWLAIEAGALVSTPDAGVTWEDRTPDGPYDTHEIALHPERPDGLRIAAGDGYYESDDGGSTWRSPEAGLEVTYLRSVAIDPGDPDVVVVSGASHAHRAYQAGRADGRLWRREGDGRWERVTVGWPEDPSTIAPLLVAGSGPGELWAADERGVHRSEDGGRSWSKVAGYERPPPWLRGLAIVASG